MNSLKTIQEFSRTPENIEGQQVVFQESRERERERVYWHKH